MGKKYCVVTSVGIYSYFNFETFLVNLTAACDHVERLNNNIPGYSTWPSYRFDYDDVMGYVRGL